MVMQKGEGEEGDIEVSKKKFGLALAMKPNGFFGEWGVGDVGDCRNEREKFI